MGWREEMTSRRTSFGAPPNGMGEGFAGEDGGNRPWVRKTGERRKGQRHQPGGAEGVQETHSHIADPVMQTLTQWSAVVRINPVLVLVVEGQPDEPLRVKVAVVGGGGDSEG